MGLVQSVAVGEAHALALGFFTKGAENGHPNPAAGRGKPDNVVIIPIDYSNHSETAFECTYILLLSFVVFPFSVKFLFLHCVLCIFFVVHISYY